jgi:hypothetical protein
VIPRGRAGFIPAADPPAVLSGAGTAFLTTPSTLGPGRGSEMDPAG